MRRHATYFFILLLMGALSVGITASAWGKTEELPIVYGSIIRDNARITFEWPQAVEHEITADGDTLSVYFAQKANPNLGQLLSNLYPFIRGSKLEAGGYVLKLTMDKAYKIRTFESDHISGIDILDIDPTRQPGFTKNAMANLSPAAGETASSTAAASISDTAKPEGVSVPENSAVNTATAEAYSGPSDATADPSKNVEQKVNGNGKLRVSFSSAEESTIIRLPFTKRIDLATFIRNNYLWVVMGETAPLSLRDYDPKIRTVIGKPEIFPADTTILRIPVSNGMSASIAQVDNSLEYTILISPNRKANLKPLEIVVNTEPPVTPHVFVDALQTGEIIAITDPVIGDEMVVVPIYTRGEGMSFAREFVDFTLQQSAQGLVVVKKSDDVTVTRLRNGLRVSKPDGAVLSKGLPKVDSSKVVKALQIVPTLFPYEKWALADGIPFRAYVRDLITKAATTADDIKANDYRLEAAQSYLGVGMGAEALAMLDGIERTDPDYFRSSKLAGLAGAANFILGRYRDSYENFARSELNNNKEMDYWRNMISDLSGREGNYDFLALNDDYIRHYPPIMRQRLAIVAADRAIDTRAYNVAIKIFETLRSGYNKETAESSKADRLIVDKKMLEDDLIAPISSYVNYLMAKIAADTGQSEESIEAMTALAGDFREPFVRARAEFSRIVWRMNKDQLNKTEVIEQLERLRLSWHGDALELKVLDFLGELYSSNSDYINAMRIWNNAVDAYAGTPKAVEIRRKLEDTFVLIFKEGIANQLPPLEALALYYQYKNYAPPGSIGREVINNLADRLVSVDLLTQAASLLEYQMRHDAEKSRRSELGANIARIYLLNNEPQKALRALQDSVYGENSNNLHQLRNRLAAKSLIELGEDDRAWQVLSSDDGAEAETLRLDILWMRRDWPRVIPTVENLLRLRKDITEPINVKESEQVIKLALAYIFENNTEQLQFLRDYFTPLMKDNPNRQLFDFITSTDVTPTPTNFEDVVRQMQFTQSFIKKYKAQAID